MGMISVWRSGSCNQKKKTEPSQTKPQKTKPLYAVFSGLQLVATTVLLFLQIKKTVENRFEPV